MGAAGTGTGDRERRGRVSVPPRQRPRVRAAADRPGQRRRTCLRERAADPELRRPRAGLRQREVRGAVPRADQPGVRRAGHGGAREPARPSTQRGIGQLVSDHGAGAREHLAYQAMGEWSPEEREALRTLAAASPDVRAQAVSDAFGEVANGVDMTAAGPPPGGDTGPPRAAAGAKRLREPWAHGDPGGSPQVRRRRSDTERPSATAPRRRRPARLARPGPLSARRRRGEACRRRPCAGACRRRASRAAPAPTNCSRTDKEA